jgi:hypothetical protein
MVPGKPMPTVEKYEATNEAVAISETTEAESRAFFDSVCRYYLGMSGPDFIENWNRGAITYEDGENDSRIQRVIAVLPFAA